MGEATGQAPEVIINTKSNLGVPYQVTQSLAAPLANEDGIQFEEGALMVNAENLVSKGQAVKLQTVSTSPNTLFLSDAKGKSDTIKANYALKVGPQQPAGLYQTKLTYTMITL